MSFAISPITDIWILTLIMPNMITVEIMLVTLLNEIFCLIPLKYPFLAIVTPQIK